MHQSDSAEVLFSTNGKRPVWSTFTARICKETGIENLTVHDLRRTVRTRLAEIGSDVVERVLGHVSKGGRAVYDRHHYLPEKRAALERWEKRLREILDAKNENGKGE